MNLSGKTALASGATGGIGMASAINFANLGANVILMARNEDKLKKTLAILDTSKGQKHSYIIADLSSDGSLEKACTQIKSLKKAIVFEELLQQH